MHSDVEQLARMAARLARRDADWRDPEFIRRAETAYAILSGGGSPEEVQRIQRGFIGLG